MYTIKEQTKRAYYNHHLMYFQNVCIILIQNYTDKDDS